MLIIWKRARVETSCSICAHIVTIDETWVHLYDPESKQESIEWRYSGSPFHLQDLRSWLVDWNMVLQDVSIFFTI